MSLNDEVKTNNREPDVIKTPVAGSRAAAAEESARPRGRMYPMEKVRAWDGSRLGYHFVKRLFDIVFSFAVIALAFVPGVILAILIRLETPAIHFMGNCASEKLIPREIQPILRCGNFAQWSRMPIR